MGKPPTRSAVFMQGRPWEFGFYFESGRCGKREGVEDGKGEGKGLLIVSAKGYHPTC